MSWICPTLGNEECIIEGFDIRNIIKLLIIAWLSGWIFSVAVIIIMANNVIQNTFMLLNVLRIVNTLTIRYIIQRDTLMCKLANGDTDQLYE